MPSCSRMHVREARPARAALTECNGGKDDNCRVLMKQLVATTEGADILTLLSRADSLYIERGRGGAVSESITLLAGSTGANERYEIQWRLARALFFLGQQAESGLARRQLHIAGTDTGKRAVRLESRRVEGHFWL